MSDADGLKVQLEIVLDKVADSVNKMAQVEQYLDEVGRELLTVAINDSRGQSPLVPAFNLSEHAKKSKDEMLQYLFEIRAIVTTYRGFL
jgi:C4-type Zn-finger protein